LYLYPCNTHFIYEKQKKLKNKSEQNRVGHAVEQANLRKNVKYPAQYVDGSMRSIVLWFVLQDDDDDGCALMPREVTDKKVWKHA